MAAENNARLPDVGACLSALKIEINQLEQSLNKDHIDRILDQLADLGGSADRRGLIDAQQAAFSMVAFLQAIKTVGLDRRDCLQIVKLLENLERALHGLSDKQVLLQSGIWKRGVQEGLSSHQIAVLVKNPGLAAVLLQRLTKAGFEVESLITRAGFLEYLLHHKPAVIIADLYLIDSEDFQWESCVGFVKSPILIMADADDLKTRLKAVRLGSHAFYKKPIDIDKLIDKLRTLTTPPDVQPYRALFVDDARIMSVLYTAAMNKVGVDTKILNDPLQALEVIDNFLPDVIVIDLYMPGCSGIELAKLLQQHESLVDISVLFLSSETDIQSQMAAFECGADDFLRKPFNEAVLQAAVLARARRSREMRSSRQENLRINEHLSRIGMAIDKHNIVSVADLAGNIVYANQRFCEISGYNVDELLGVNHRIVKSDHHPAAFYKQLWSTIRRGETWHGEICNRRKDGSLYWVDATITPELNRYGLIDRYIAVRTDITAIKNMQEQLQIARDEAESASQSKSLFLGHMSHEFKTPLNSIIGFSQLLQSDPDAPLNEEQVEMLSVIERGGYHLLDLINDLVDQARIETGHLKLDMQSVGLKALIQEGLALLSPQIQQRGISIHLKDLQSTHTVYADRIRVKQVFLNLLSNAVKYNRHQGSVTISCESQNGICRLSVIDTGHGIASQDIAKLFQPFSRVVKVERNVEGSGIGLALSKNLIERMNGEIGVKSCVGEGSEFWFSLPTAPQPK
ncbi:MAG: hypothetical protein RL563_851 [Pseudomonadota bacterium]